MSGQVGKNLRVEIWQMAKNYMLILLLSVMIKKKKCYDQRVNWTGPYSYIFPLKPIVPTKEHEGICCFKGACYTLEFLRAENRCFK